MANTYTLIGSPIVVGSGGAFAINFTSIPNTFTDLLVKYSLRSNSGAGGAWDNLSVTLNGSGSGYSEKLLYGLDGSAGSDGNSSNAFFYVPRAAATANTFSNNEIYLPNYAGSNYKSISAESVVENNSSASWLVGMTAFLWSNTAAVNQITLTASAGNSFVQYSTAYLYGISNS